MGAMALTIVDRAVGDDQYEVQGGRPVHVNQMKMHILEFEPRLDITAQQYPRVGTTT